MATKKKVKSEMTSSWEGCDQWVAYTQSILYICIYVYFIYSIWLICQDDDSFILHLPLLCHYVWKAEFYAQLPQLSEDHYSCKHSVGLLSVLQTKHWMPTGASLFEQWCSHCLQPVYTSTQRTNPSWTSPSRISYDEGKNFSGAVCYPCGGKIEKKIIIIQKKTTKHCIV